MVYNVSHTSQYPITLWYSARSTLPVRTVVYRQIRAIKGFRADRFGKVKIGKLWVFVAFVRGQWESIAPIEPIGRILFAS